MKLLRFLAFCLLASILFLPAVFAQTSQAPDSKQPATPQAPQAQSPAQPAQPPSGDFLRNPFAPPASGQSSPAPQWRDRKFRIRLVPGRGLDKKFQPQPLRQGPMDPGIYLPRAAGLGHICGSIVSYNFSPGENPRLDSITTCTSADMVQSRRAQHEDEKPPEPGLVRTKY